jgi:hypothetical protein
LSDAFNAFHEKGREKVMSFISNLFDSCGGGIIATGASGNTMTSIVFRCFHHRVHVSQKNKNEDKKSKNTVTSRPTSKDDNCSWRFTLYFEPMGAEREG